MKLIFTLLLTSLLHSIYAQNPLLIAEPKVDNRMELLSIVFRLAGSDEYNMSKFDRYTQKVDAHYAPYKDHPLIEFVKSEKEVHGIAYDAVMVMAIHLDKALQPRVAFSENIPDPRWGKVDHQKFLMLLQDFYIASGSKTFFETIKPLQQQVSKKFYPIYEQLDAAWFADLFGTASRDDFYIINALGNGGANYGTAINLPNGDREVYAILGTWDFDSLGMAQFPFDPYFVTMVHEFAHSFVNPLLERNRASFEQVGPQLFALLKPKMESQAYGEWGTMLNEALVRATVIKYMKDHGFPQAELDQEIANQQEQGFYWVGELVDEIEQYTANRKDYPTFDNYMPRLAQAYEQYVLTVSRRKPEVLIPN